MIKGKHKIAFIFLDDIHHIFHFVSIAVELAKHNTVHILTYPDKHEFLFNTLKQLDGKNVIVEKLRTKAFRAFTDKLKKRRLPRKGFWIKKHQNYILDNFDAIIFTGYFHYYFLRARGYRATPKFMFLQHGTPGRAYSYSKDVLDFDFQLLCGNFHFENLKKLGLLKSDYKITGYPKFDVVENIQSTKIFNTEKPTILYNPHFAPPFSSWHAMGIAILEFFYNSNQYNLIFAPHINLFNKLGYEDKTTIPKKYSDCINIHVDLGSIKSVNMDYVKNADIYLGDVSSQSFEFMMNPRPCIFLNPDNIEFQDDLNYRFWQCGEVLTSASQLEEALKNATELFEKKYKPIQQKITAENYYTEAGTNASQQSALAITEYLDENL